MHPGQQRVLDALADGARLTHAGIIEETGLDYVQAYSAMKVLLNGRVKRIIKIGTWAELCAETGEPMGSVRKDAGVYALSGTPLLKPLRDGKLPPRIGGGQGRRKGSGVIAPPPYVTGFRWGLR